MQQALQLSGSFAGLAVAPLDKDANDRVDRLLDRLCSAQGVATPELEHTHSKSLCASAAGMNAPGHSSLVAELLAAAASASAPVEVAPVEDAAGAFAAVRREPGLPEPMCAAPPRRLCSDHCTALWRTTAGAALALRAQMRATLQVDSVPASPSLQKIAPPVLTVCCLSYVSTGCARPLQHLVLGLHLLA